MAVSEQLLGRYRLGRHLIRADRSGRKPALAEADDGGAFLFAKLWPKATDTPEVRALWNHEVRSLLRVAGYPRAAEFFVRLRDLGEDERRHFVIVDAGERRLLSELLRDRKRYPWLRDLNVPANRRRMWEGLKRIATGVSILHAEGTLHRTLDSSAVFSDSEGNFDFRLSGFEWSLRMVSAAGTPTRPRGQDSRIQAPELDKGTAGHSFASDWFDFGVLVAEILGIPTTGRGAKAVERLQTAVDAVPFLTHAEKAFIVGLLAADPEFRLSKSSSVLQGISEAASAARNPSLFAKKPLYVGFALGPGSRVTEAIQQASGDSLKISPTDYPAQIRFIEKDISGDVQILVRQLPTPHYVIDGRLLQYKVKKWTRGGQSTWDVGFCNSVEWPSVDPTERVARLDGRTIEVRAAPELSRNLARAKQIGVDWPAVLPFEETHELLDQQQRFTLDFFRLTNQLDALLTAAQLWPVRVVSTGFDAGQVVIDVTPVRDTLRDALAQNLNLSPPDEQMRSFFTGDEAQHRFSEDAEFTLATEGVLGRSEQESRVRWRFKQATEHPAGPRYRFWHEESGAATPEVGEQLYLIPRDIAGSVAQLKRRHRAIESMRNHASLLTALASPEQARHDMILGQDHADQPIADPAKLDESKQRALKGILSTQPLYALQGPPGTGKTHLLEALVSLLLSEDASLRILVSAQSHEAVDIVKRKLDRTFSDLPAARRPLMVRLDNEEDPLHARPVSADFAKRLAGSELARSAPQHLQARANAACATTGGNATASLDVKSFEALVRSAANVVFATSNSGELERMLEGTQRFDWSIVEEAGKAHGFDLALALQASHRLLLIGDQEQLPPFNFEALERLLAEPLRIKNALTVGYRFAPGLVDRSAGGDNAEQFAADCAAWRDMVHFFGALYQRSRASERNGISLATRLRTQHRMHPHIAELVSRAFYDKELETDKERASAFLDNHPPFELRVGSWLPHERLVFLDVPWVQAAPNAAGERGGADGYRRYSNVTEAELACDALSQFTPIPGQRCHIQLLTPYHAQRKLLADMIRDEIASGPLEQLKSPEFDIEQPHLGMTVDSFQGGEADVVIASLVRNNDRPKGKGLGILGDGRRLNVLLSRARHKLIIIGSWDFLRSRFEDDQPPTREDPLFAIYNFLKVFSDLEKEKKARRLSFDVDGKLA